MLHLCRDPLPHLREDRNPFTLQSTAAGSYLYTGAARASLKPRPEPCSWCRIPGFVGFSSQPTLTSHHSMCAGPGCQEIVEPLAQSSALLSPDLPCSAQASSHTNNGRGIFFWSKDHPETKDAAKLPHIIKRQRGVHLSATGFDSGSYSARQTELHLQLLFS